MGACLSCSCPTSYEIWVELDKPSGIESFLFNRTLSAKLTVRVNDKVIPREHLEIFLTKLRQALGIKSSTLKFHSDGSVTISSEQISSEKLGHCKMTAQAIMEDLIRKGYPYNTACLV